MIPNQWLVNAAERIIPYIHETPLVYDQELDVFIKWENQQRSGSFKIRGAFNKVMTMQSWELERGLVTASAGNHGLGVALAGKQFNTHVTVFTSESASQIKIEALVEAGAELMVVKGGFSDAEKAGLEYAKEINSTWISPYNDGQVIAGQATLGIEVLKQLNGNKVNTWVVPVSGGGLISGIGACIKASPDSPWFTDSGGYQPTQLIGVQAAASPFMHAYFYTGNQENAIDLPSLADGLTGAVEPGSITFPLVKEYVDEILLLSEDEIALGITYAWEKYGQIIEGSGAISLAIMLGNHKLSKPAVLVISGGNIQAQIHQSVIDKWTHK